MSEMRQLGQTCNARDNGAATSPSLDQADEDGFSPSQEAARFEILNSLGVDHSYVCKKGAGSEALGWEKTCPLKGE